MSRKQTRTTNDPRLGPSSRRIQLAGIGLREQAEKPQEWVAEVFKAERCSSVEYRLNQWSKVFEYSQHLKHERCYLRGTGGLQDLTLTLFTTAVIHDPNPQNIHTFSFPAAVAKISLRLYDATALIEIFTDPKKKRGEAVAAGDYWAIFLRGHNDYEKKNAGAMLRRLENIAREMPDNWFSYRNFFTVPGHATDTSGPPPVAVGQYNHEMAGGSAKFSGNFATAKFLEALGHRNFRPRLGETNVTTRKMARESDAYRFSTVLPALRPRSKGQRKSARLEKLEAQRSRRARSEAASSDSGPVRLQFPIVVIRAKSGQVAEQSAGETNPAADERTSTRSPTVVANPPSESGSSSSQDYPIKRIVDDRIEDGVPEVLVEWEEEGHDYWWLPEDDVSAEALRVYREAKEASSSKKRKAPAKRGRGRPPKKSNK
ncbi:MAG: hypothetical protein L6R35_003072 [Caloplaca aegaea]|nr:MAG: hypothetical protein L6R35_003072 [Caloplaca aegaea]